MRRSTIGLFRQVEHGLKVTLVVVLVGSAVGLFALTARTLWFVVMLS